MEQLADAARVAARPRLDHVDGLRAVAALVVFVNHAFAQIWNRVYTPPPEFRLFRWSLVAGHLSVTVFIVISGFCLALPVIENGGELRGGVKQFLRRRARRILPPYYAALALCLLLIGTIIGKPSGTLWDVPILAGPLSIVSHVLLLQDFFATGHINYVFWSIAVEWHIYFLMPVLVLAWRKYGAVATVMGSMLVGYALMLGFAHTRVARANLHFVGMFTLGMLAAYVARSQEPGMLAWQRRVPWHGVAIGGLGAVVALAGHYGVDESAFHVPLIDLPAGLMTMALLVLTSKPTPAGIHRVLAWRPLVFVGTFSYSLYLIHAPLLQIQWQYALSRWNMTDGSRFVALMTVGLVLTLAFAYGFHRLFEAPFMRPARPRQSAQSPLPAR